MKRLTDWRKRLVDWVPLPFLTHAHELAVAGVLLVLGLPALLGLLPGQGTDADPLTWPMWEVWGLGQTVGVACTVWGIFHSRPRLEWAGQLLAGWGLLFWAGILAAVVGVAQYGTIAIFILLALASFWRAFKITSQPYVQHRLVRATREATMAVRDEQHQTGRRRT